MSSTFEIILVFLIVIGIILFLVNDSSTTVSEIKQDIQQKTQEKSQQLFFDTLIKQINPFQ